MIAGLFETHIAVSDLERSMRFYGEVLGLEQGMFEEGRRAAFYWIGGHGEAMLGLWERPSPIEPQHFAFRASVENVLSHAVNYLTERGLRAYNFLNDGTGRPMVFAWMPAVAIYFKDPDGHELELIAMLPEQPRPEVGVVSWETWRRLSNHQT